MELDGDVESPTVVCKTNQTRKSSCGKLQNTYRPQHNLSKHILSLGGGVPTLAGGGVPPPPC